MPRWFRAVALVWVSAGTTVMGGSELPRGVAMYWDADRPSHGWRDKQWQKGGTGRIHYDAGVKKHGYASVRLEGVESEGTGIGSGCVPAVVDPGRSYVLRFWARRTGAAGAKAEARVFAAAHILERRCKPIGWVKLADGTTAVPIPVSAEWAMVTAALASLPAGADRLIVGFEVTGRSTVWIDETSLAETGVDVPLGGRPALTDADYAGIRLEDSDLPQNLLQNAGFEDARIAPWEHLPGERPASLDRTTSLTGAAALRFDAREFTGGGVWQKVAIDSRRRYRLSLRASCQGLVGYLFTKVLPFNRYGVPTGWVGEEILVTGTTNGWEDRTIEFLPRPDSAHVNIYVRVQDTIGQVWVDDVRLEPLPLEGARQEAGR